MFVKDIDFKSKILGSFTSYFNSLSNPEIGYLCVKKPEEAVYRDLLCKMQGEKHIPFMKMIAKKEYETWYKTQHLPRYKTIKTCCLGYIHSIPLSTLDFLSDSLKDTIRLLISELQKGDEEFYNHTKLDIKGTNIRTDGSQEFLTDIFYYSDY